MQVTIKDKQVELVDGEFTSAQALDILNALIDQLINYHKIENLQNWEHNHNIDSNPYFKKIHELEEQKKTINSNLSEIKQNGQKLIVNGVFTLKPVE